ncbi:hypothetical protein V5S96_06435 [Corynebacterium mastitidis]|uniref:Uncharacterized protein n=1 Tax=Corynebacterium mastitidis TaxID=161890 RepID=A0ABU8NYA1_9CORY
MHTLTALTAGLSTPSSTRQIAEQIAQAASDHLGQVGCEVEVTTIELRDLAADLASAMTSGGC